MGLPTSHPVTLPPGFFISQESLLLPACHEEGNGDSQELEFTSQWYVARQVGAARSGL